MIKNTQKNGSDEFKTKENNNISYIFLFFHFFSSNELIKFPFRYIFYFIELIQIISFSFMTQVI